MPVVSPKEDVDSAREENGSKVRPGRGDALALGAELMVILGELDLRRASCCDHDSWRAGMGLSAGRWGERRPDIRGVPTVLRCDEGLGLKSLDPRKSRGSCAFVGTGEPSWISASSMSAERGSSFGEKRLGSGSERTELRVEGGGRSP